MMKLQADRGSGDSQSNALFPIFISLTSRGWQGRRIKRGKPNQGLAFVVNAYGQCLCPMLQILS